MTEMTIAGETFNVVVEGEEDAPVLMLSNSLGTNLHMWDPQMPALLEHFRVVRYDARGHGSSVVSEGPYSIDQLGRDALAIMDELGLEKVHWLGISKGGMIGQWLLTHAPERIGKAVLANTAAQMGTAEMWNDRIRTVLDEGTEALAAASAERWFTRNFRESQPETVQTVTEMLRAIAPEGYAACCSAIRDMDQREAIRGITNPVLVIVGRHDPSTPPGMGALIASSIPHAKLVTLEAAHLSNLEDPENFNNAVIGFLTAEEVPAEEEPQEEAAIEERPARRRAPAKRAPAKKAAAKKAPAKKTVAKKAVVKKAVPGKATAKKAAVKKAPAKKAPVKKAPVKKAAAKKAATKKLAVKKAPAKSAPAKKAALKRAPAKKAAAKKTALKKMPARKAVPVKKAQPKTIGRKTATKKTTGRRK